MRERASASDESSEVIVTARRHLALGAGSIGFDATDWKKVEEPLKVLLTTAAEAVDQGLFPAAAKSCDKCDYRTLCGPGAEKRGETKKEYFKLEELI